MGRLLIFLIICILIISVACLIWSFIKQYNFELNKYQKQINILTKTIKDMQLEQKRKELNDKIHNKEIKNT